MTDYRKPDAYSPPQFADDRAMTDIVERLRDPNRLMKKLSRDALEAADEIERLTAHYADRQALVLSQQEEIERLADKICNYAGEIARLKARITEFYDTQGGKVNSPSIR